ncbi:MULTISPECIES: hypothetical protein [Pseudoalteromonas]|uniref:Uncharacterized protein n=1 Tax=Pseudoalteromonas amylolytica TaxID=1859457 RepID=A0A1S1N1Z4_9GAMM|nr:MULTISPECIES: hypothetical protein [Pseudoalteromonas]OHU89305.1 hypothetical protein BFC16_06655 [Pseudoalteromonas sp. JW3]OHU92205.1 hypothetical protein BET10_07760 [Pseudoalteromonas amylolytica]
MLWLASIFYNWVSNAKPLMATQGNETRSKVHWLSEHKPLIYTFSPTRTESIRILSNAILGQVQSHQQSVDYAIDYALLDKQQRVIYRATYHHTANATQDNEQQKAKQIIEQRESLSVSSGQSFYINNARFSDATAIALSLRSEGQTIKGVVARVHAKTNVKVEDSMSAWLKYPLSWRARISHYHTLGPNAVSEEEIANAVRYDWNKLAPQGVPGVDFDSDTLYEMLPYNILGNDFPNNPVNQDAFYTDSELSASLKVDTSQDIYFVSEQATQLRLTWYDLEEISPPLVLHPEHTATANLYKLALIKPGMINMSSNRTVVSKWYYQNMQPVTPLHSLYYQIDKGSDVKYSTVPNSDLKFDFRANQTSQVVVKLYNSKGEVIDQFSISITPNLSQFDRIILADTTRAKVSDSQPWYIRNLSKEAAYLRVYSNKQVLVKLQTRQAHFHYQDTLCKPACSVSTGNVTEIPAWFAQKADNDHALKSQGKTSKVRLFLAPPALQNKDSFYSSKELTAQLPVSNTALVNTSQPYYRALLEPKTFHFKKLADGNTFKQLQQSLTADQTLIVQRSTPPYIQELKANLISAAQAADEQGVTLYLNHGLNRHWAKQRLFLLKADKTLTLSFNTLPQSVVVKAYVASQTDRAIELNYRLKGVFHNTPVHTYSIARKRLLLHPSDFTQAFMLHPTIGRLTPYPNVTVPINDDIKQLEQLVIHSDTDIWINIIDEYAQQPKRLNWWLDEDT